MNALTTIEFGRPQRTANAVFVPITKGTRVTISDISYINIRAGAAFTITIRVPWDNWAAEQLEILDTEALAATHVNNGTWFTNALSEDQINELFEPTVDRVDASRGVQIQMQTSMKNPPKLTLGESLSKGESESLSMDAFHRLWTHAPKRSLTATAVVDVAGIFFEKRRFRLRLVLRSLEATSAVDADLMPDKAGVKADVEDNWDAQIASHLEPALQAARVRLADLESTHAALKANLEAARALSTMGSSWRERLAIIERTIQDLQDSRANI